MEGTNLTEVIHYHQMMTEYRDKRYINFVQQANTKAYELFHNDDPGNEFVRSCARDLAGEVVRAFFDTGAYHVSADQLCRRIISFSYDNDYDPLVEEIHKKAYNYDDYPMSWTQDIGIKILNRTSHIDQLRANIDAETKNHKLFEKDENKRYIDHGMIKKGKDQYVEKHRNVDGSIEDEYTGRKGEYHTNKKGVEVRREEVDHVQAIATAVTNEYMSERGIQELKQYLNSSDNFAMMDKAANCSKGDVRVFDHQGNDITHRATPRQLADAISDRWENARNKEELKRIGYLDEDGKVNKAVKHKLIENIKTSQNGESWIILKNANKKAIAEDALKEISFEKIIAGQIIYYAVPPMLYEVRLLIQEDISLDQIIDRLSQAGERICRYLVDHLKDIFHNIAINTIKEFVKNFMDIFIHILKASVQRLMKMAKDVLLATIDAVNIIADPNASEAEKADSVVNLYSVTVTNVVIEILFEFIRDAYQIPDVICTPLQIVTSVVCTNLVMLILKQVDLFDTRFGFKVNAVKNLFEKERIKYLEEIEVSEQVFGDHIDYLLRKAEDSIKVTLDQLDQYDYSIIQVDEQVEVISSTFDLKIDFQREWERFIGLEQPKPLKVFKSEVFKDHLKDVQKSGNIESLRKQEAIAEFKIYANRQSIKTYLYGRVLNGIFRKNDNVVIKSDKGEMEGVINYIEEKGKETKECKKGEIAKIWITGYSIKGNETNIVKFKPSGSQNQDKSLEIPDSSRESESATSSFENDDNKSESFEETVIEYRKYWIEEKHLRLEPYFTKEDGEIFYLLRDLYATNYSDNKQWEEKLVYVAGFYNRLARAVSHDSLIGKKYFRDEVINAKKIEEAYNSGRACICLKSETGQAPWGCLNRNPLKEAAWGAVHGFLFTGIEKKETLISLKYIKKLIPIGKISLMETWNQYLLLMDDVPSEIKELFRLDNTGHCSFENCN